MQIVSIGDNLHEMSNLFSGKNKKNISKCCLLENFPRVLGVNKITDPDKRGFMVMYGEDAKALLTGSCNIGFHGEIRKMSIFFSTKKKVS